MRLYHIWRRFWTIIVQIFFPYKLEDFLHHRYCSVCFTTTDIARNEAKYTLKKIRRTRTQYKEFAETGLTSCRMSNFLIVVWGRSSQGRLGYNTPHKDHRIYVAVLWRTSSASDITWEYCFLFCFFFFLFTIFSPDGNRKWTQCLFFFWNCNVKSLKYKDSIFCLFFLIFMAGVLQFNQKCSSWWINGRLDKIVSICFALLKVEWK